MPILWPLIFGTGHEIAFAHTSFKWANLASYNAGVTVIIVAISRYPNKVRRLFSVGEDRTTIVKEVANINAYLVPGADIIVTKAAKPLTEVAEMTFGSKPVDGGHLLLSWEELTALGLDSTEEGRFIRPMVGSEEFITGRQRFCIWIRDEEANDAQAHPIIGPRLDAVRAMRLNSSKAATRAGAEWPYRFDERRQIGDEKIIVVPAVSSENRQYLPCGLLPPGYIISNRNFGVFNAPIWNLGVIASRMHWVWIDAVCGKLETRFNYSNTLGWNTFPVPALTEKNKGDLARCAEDILLAREAYFPATIADLYDPDNMPADLREVHERNDEVLERIYIGRRFRNDTERLEKLFELYTKMTAGAGAKKKKVGASA